MILIKRDGDKLLFQAGELGAYIVCSKDEPIQVRIGNHSYSFDITTFLDQIADETRSPGEQEFLELQQERDRLAEELDRFTAARAAIETAGHHIALIKQAWSTA